VSERSSEIEMLESVTDIFFAIKVWGCYIVYNMDRKDAGAWLLCITNTLSLNGFCNMIRGKEYGAKIYIFFVK
jgi:hypothetical protein